MNGNLSITAYLVLAAYLAATLLLGLSFTRNQKNLAGYFLAERSCALVGRGNFCTRLRSISYLIYGALLLDVLPRLSICDGNVLVPRHRDRGRLYLHTVLGPNEHLHDLRVPGAPLRAGKSAVCLGRFSSTTLAHMAVAVYAISLALQQVVGWPVWACVAAVGGLTTVYTVFGGMKAVLWTDVMQFFVLVGGIVAMSAVVLWSFHGDILRIWQVAADAGHTKMFTFSADFLDASFWKEMTFWGICLGQVVTHVGAYGSDQVLVQRYLAAGSARQMARSLIFSGLITVPVLIALYLLGLGFFAYYHVPEHAGAMRFA